MRQEAEPATAEIDEVAPGILRMQLPLRMPGLGHVNCYALEDEKGFTLVDPGMRGPQAWKILIERFKLAGFDLRHVHTVVVTHSHIDHFGASGRLRLEAGAQVVTSSTFRTWWDPTDVGEQELEQETQPDPRAPWKMETHISGIDAGPDPLSDFFVSLDKVSELDGVTRVLPAHGHPFDDLTARVKDIHRHHEERLAKLSEAAERLGEAPVEELSKHLFRQRSWGPMADSETYAHLEHLRLGGKASRREEDGRLLYSLR